MEKVLTINEFFKTKSLQEIIDNLDVKPNNIVNVSDLDTSLMKTMSYENGYKDNDLVLIFDKKVNTHKISKKFKKYKPFVYNPLVNSVNKENAIIVKKN